MLKLIQIVDLENSYRTMTRNYLELQKSRKEVILEPVLYFNLIR